MRTERQRREQITEGISRRSLLGAVGLGGAAVALGGAPARAAARTAPCAPAATGSINDVDHVVIFMQENRPFDHYFGSLAGVRGFGDPTAVRADGSSLFRQPDVKSATGVAWPFELASNTTIGQYTMSLSHDYGPQHQSWQNGAMSDWLAAHRAADGDTYGPLTMGYYTRADLPYQYGLADNFMVLDGYHASVMGPTFPNRISLMTGTVDPSGPTPAVTNQTGTLYTFETYPERLEKAGISWKVYVDADDDEGNNILSLFASYQDETSTLYQKGRLVGGRAQFLADAAAGNLPQVSWVVGTTAECEHPPAPPAAGATYFQPMYQALTSNAAAWAKTLVIYNYDENDGYFDHVAPPVAPPGTKGEYVTGAMAADYPGPVGLGFRVPCLLLSPWSTGNLVCSDVFDHTSTLLFLEKRFGVEANLVSDWRRSVVGDLTSALDFANPTTTVPDLTTQFAAAVTLLAAPMSVADLGSPTIPVTTGVPAQEQGTRVRRGGTPAAACATPVLAVGATAATTQASPTTTALRSGTTSLAATGGLPLVAGAAALVAAGAVVRARSSSGADPEA